MNNERNELFGESFNLFLVIPVMKERRAANLKALRELQKKAKKKTKK